MERILTVQTMQLGKGLKDAETIKVKAGYI